MDSKNVLTSEELEHLAEVREVTVTANSAGWIRIQQQMEKFVSEALDDMRQAAYASAEAKAGLQTRWQQREAMLLGVKQYIEQCQAEKTLLLETAQRSVPPYAEQDRNVA